MNDRYPNFRRAQRERGPYYRGPASVVPFRRKTMLAFGLIAAILIGVAIGWNF